MVYVFLADGFEETEAVTPIDYLRRSGCNAVTVGVTGKTVTSSHNIPMICDIELDEAVTEGLEMIVLPGGKVGTDNLIASKRVEEIIDYCVKKGLFIGAICAAPSVLGLRGLLSGKKAVCYPGFEEKLHGADIQNAPAVRDGIFITGRGAGASLEFSYELAAALKGEEKAKEVAGSIVWNI
ncbi:MAG: DJ-1/PfpI family protein [Ruminococcus sp.]|nr:DJ-1/PfpI family protein [Ruminococcus sp.]